MLSATEQRIAQRNFVTHQRMQKQGTFGQLISGAWLAIRNGVDRITGWADDDRALFLGATSAGLVRGALYGASIAIFALAVFNPVSAVILPLFFGSTIACALAYGIYDGQAKLEDHANYEAKKVASTAVAGKELQSPGQQPQTQKQANAAAENPGYAKREDTRRMEAATVQR